MKPDKDNHKPYLASSNKLIKVLNSYLDNDYLFISYQRYELDISLQQKKEHLYELLKYIRNNGYFHIVMLCRCKTCIDDNSQTDDVFGVLVLNKSVTGKLSTSDDFVKFAYNICKEDGCIALLKKNNDYILEDGEKVDLPFNNSIKDVISYIFDKHKTTSCKLESLFIIGNSRYQMVAECRKKGDLRTSHLLSLDEYGSMMDFDVINETFITDNHIRKEVFGWL